MAKEEEKQKNHQLFVRMLDGRTSVFNFETQTVPVLTLKSQIESLTTIPIPSQRFVSSGLNLQDDQTIMIPNRPDEFPTIHLLLRLLGGKGGFGSLLRGSANKAGQKKTNNFDACRDMSGRRLRHVNAEKKMEEWKAEEELRKFEKVAEEFVRNQVKEGKKQGKGGESAAEKYVEKYRKDSARCMEEVDKTVRESLGDFFKKGSKRAGEANGTESMKKLKIWKGKGKLYGSDSDDSDEDDNDDDMGDQNEKSVVINDGNHSDSVKEADGSSVSVTDAKLEGESSVGCSSESGSEEEKDTVESRSLKLSGSSPCGGALGQGDGVKEPALKISEENMVRSKDDSCLKLAAACDVEAALAENQGDGVKEPALRIHEESMVWSKEDFCLEGAAASEVEDAPAEKEEFNKPEPCNIEEAVACQSPSISTLVECKGTDVEANGNSDSKPENRVETVAASSTVPDLVKPLNFDEYSSAVEMEVLGINRLKSELQERGLKCGGTLQERAARLFMLKTTPLEKLPKKLLAKK